LGIKTVGSKTRRGVKPLSNPSNAFLFFFVPQVFCLFTSAQHFEQIIVEISAPIHVGHKTLNIFST
jgi:hypothetical protein